MVIPPDLRNNFRRLYADIFWFGVLSGSTMAFVSIYAARLGATGLQIGLLTAGPALVNLLFSLPAGRWLEGQPLIRASFWSALLHRLGYLALIALPCLAGQLRANPGPGPDHFDDVPARNDFSDRL